MKIRNIIVVMIIALIWGPFAYALAPMSQAEPVAKGNLDVAFLQEQVYQAIDDINAERDETLISDAYIFGSPIILQENGYINEENVNDIDIMVVIDKKLKGTPQERRLMKDLEKRVRKTIKFDKIEFIPRVVNRAFFNVFFKNYLKQLLAKLKDNEIMLDGKWHKVKSKLFTDKFVKRYLELLFYTQGETEEFLAFRERYLQAKKHEDIQALKDEAFSKIQEWESLDFSNYRGPFQVLDELIQRRKTSMKPSDILSDSTSSLKGAA